MSSATVPFVMKELNYTPERTRAERLVSEPFLKWLTCPENILDFNTESFVVDGNCSFFSLLLRSSVFPRYIKSRRKDVWIEKGEFPTAFQHKKIHYCGQPSFPNSILHLLVSSSYYKWQTTFSKVFLGKEKRKKESDNITRKATTDMVDIDAIYQPRWKLSFAKS